MSTASIIHRPVPRTVAAAAVVACVAFAGLTVALRDSGTTTTIAPWHPHVAMPNPDANYQRPMHGGSQFGP